MSTAFARVDLHPSASETTSGQPGKLVGPVGGDGGWTRCGDDCKMECRGIHLAQKLMSLSMLSCLAMLDLPLSLHHIAQTSTDTSPTSVNPDPVAHIHLCRFAHPPAPQAAQDAQATCVYNILRCLLTAMVHNYDGTTHERKH
ncbi:hypothetical protein FB45DRAFT_1018591 [Roridomyces roridus]|uniref:Uncharacterized protein n=1 Tax=Roridomyces roridus TaxID=1738132 RepID=A0AAD7G1Z5_9AGAR|nr:hypothetical protein FB45DRAFT_1018558 [Roridomyces roridus]KAJ7651240.1 hypothetical protein FB45DRAFT_1018591 [Roridomyces roridus]